jgi:hypothetical protein
MDDLRAKAIVVIMMRDGETDDMVALSLSLADDIMNFRFLK